MRAMRVGQRAFMYQSACKVPGVTGIIEIVKEAYPDNEQFDPKSKYYDSKASEDNPKWSMVDIKFVCILPLVSVCLQLPRISLRVSEKGLTWWMKRNCFGPTL